MFKDGQKVPIKSVGHALNILECFKHNEDLGISEISAQLGRSKSTIHALVNTLAQWGYLEQSKETRKYRLGMALLEMGSVVRNRLDIRTEARPWCQKLAEQFDTTVHLAVMSAGEVIYIDKVNDGSSSVTYSQIGKRAPMYCTGIGKAILAFQPMEQIEKYIFSKPRVQFTPNTITDRDALLVELEKIRNQGYAIDDEEIELGVTCFAAPIFSQRDTPVYAISMSFLQARLEGGPVTDMVTKIKECAATISARMGYPRP